MRKLRMLVLSGVALAVIVTGAAVLAQQKSAKPAKLSADDWIEIFQLYGRYTHLIDNGEEKGYAYARLWTEDAIFEFGGQQHKGRDELANVAMYGIQDPPIVRPLHHAFNITIDPSPEGARGQAYLALINANKPGEPHTIMTRGIYDDIFVKTKDGWRFKYRKFTPAAFSTEGNTTTRRVPPKQ